MLHRQLTGQVIEAAMCVHSTLGAGLFEEVYKVCLRHELKQRGIKVLSEVGLPVTDGNAKLEVGYRIDLLVEENIIVELKSAERISPVHKAQLLTYLKLAKLQVGLLINFNVPHLKDGILRVVNTLSPSVVTSSPAS